MKRSGWHFIQWRGFSGRSHWTKHRFRWTGDGWVDSKGFGLPSAIRLNIIRVKRCTPPKKREGGKG